MASFDLEKKRYGEAEKHFKKLLALDPDFSTKSDAKWKLAWISTWGRNYSEAASLFKEARVGGAGGRSENASKYWQASSLILAGKPDEARRLLKEIIVDHPLDYYATESARTLKSLGSKDCVSPTTVQIFPNTEITKDQLANPLILSAKKLLEQGLPEFAVINLDALSRADRSSPSIAFLLARALHSWGRYQRAQDALVAGFGSMVDNPPENAPGEFVEIAFPRINFSETMKTAEKHSVDPHLVWAIIRQESRYDASAVSPAGALGLMQVMPASAGLIRKNGKVPPKVIEEMLEPSKNLAYGVKILANNLSLFHGKLVPAVASYNADIKKVKEWVAKNDKMKPDEFIESIPYLETRTYVKKVLSGYRAYSKLHRKRDLVGLW